MKTLQKYSISLFISIIFSYAYIQGAEVEQKAVPDDRDSIGTAVNNNIDLFASDELLYITLTFDMRNFLRTKSNPEYIDASITMRISDSVSLSRDIKLKARGEMRREYCDFPPILLKFKDDDGEPLRIKGCGKYKLVTHCKLSPVNENYLLKEYLVYKLYNKVTPYSYRTRLAEINYVDINRPDKAFTTYGFLIEDEDDMAARIKAVPNKNMKLTQKHMVPVEMVRTALFQYMIGNTDWAVPSQHNVKIVKSTELLTDKAIAVAYDFDYSGFVGTSYATPALELPIKLVTERYYLGICVPEEVLTDVVAEFSSLQGEFLGTIASFDVLPNDSKKLAESYINSFYKMYKNQKSLINCLNNTCKRF